MIKAGSTVFSKGFRLFVLLVLAAAQFWCQRAYSTEDESTGEESTQEDGDTQSEEGLTEASVDWLLDQREGWSERVVAVGSFLDNFLAGDEAKRRTNRSYVQAELFGTYKEGGEFEFDPDLRFRLDLPQTRERYRLVVENYSSDNLSPEERSRDNPATSRDDDSSFVDAFLRYVRERDNLTTRADIGLQFPSPIRPFIRLRADWYTALSPNWLFRTESVPYYAIGDEFIFNQDFYFDYRLGENALLRFQTEAQWRTDDPYWEFGEIISYTQRITERSVAVQSLGWLGDSLGGLKTTGYYARFTWRTRLYDDWFFGEISPEVFYDRDTGFQDETSLTMGLEVILSK